MKFIELTRIPNRDLVLLNPNGILTLSPIGKTDAEGTIINGDLWVEESIDDIKRAIGPGRKPKY